jgi:dimethylamine monooxygenase subunit A
MSLAELFSDGDYRFQPALRRGSAAEFFKPTAAHTDLCVERTRWLRSAPHLYCATLPEVHPLLDECFALAAEWGCITTEDRELLSDTKETSQLCVRIGELWEPDFLLLKPSDGDDFVLLGGCVCFPSSWRLDEKLGRPLHFIHGAVPELNPQLGRSITSILRALKPESAWLRHNWGLTRSTELNQHPSRTLPRLDASVALDEVWLRVEHQALVALPNSGGVLFGIRIAVHSLSEVKADETARERLMHALRTMPENIAAYKGIAAARGRLLELLESPRP